MASSNSGWTEVPVSGATEGSGWEEVPISAEPAKPSGGWEEVPISAPTEPPTRTEPRDFAKQIVEKDVSWGVASPEEIAAIAKRNGVDPEWLRDAAGWNRLVPAESAEDARSFFPGSPTDYLKSAAGQVTDIVPFGETVKGAIRKTFFTEAEQRAMDDLRALADEKRPDSVDVAEFAAMGGVGAKAGLGLAKYGSEYLRLAGWGDRAIRAAGVVSATAGGATSGALVSDTGDEGLGAIVGGTFGLAAPVVLGAVAKGARAGVEKVREVAGNRVVDALAEVAEKHDVVGRARAAMSKAKDAEDALARVVLAGDDATQSLEKFARSVSADDTRRLAGLSRLAPEAIDDATTKGAREVLGLADEAADEVARAYSVAKQAAGEFRGAAKIGNIKTRDLEAYTEREGGEFARRQFDRLREAQYTTRELMKVMSPAIDVGAGKLVATDAAAEIGGLRRAWLFLADGRYVYDAIDGRFGTRLAPTLDRLSSRYNAYTAARNVAAKSARSAIDVVQAAEPKTLKGEDFRTAAWSALDSGDFDPTRFTEKQRGALRAWNRVFSGLADQADNLHRDFPDLDLSPLRVQRKLAGAEKSYVPHYLKSTPEFVAEVEQRWRALGPDARESLVDRARAFRDGADTSGAGKEAHELLLAHEIYAGKPITSFTELATQNALLLKGRRVGEALATQAASLFERRGEIPEWLLEKDLAKLADKWSHGMFRHAFLRDGLSELLTASTVVSKFSPTLGKYIRNHVADLSGVRSGTLASASQEAFDRFRVAAERRARNAKSPAARAAWKLAAQSDDILRASSGNMYSYYLGLNPSSAFRNYFQPLSLTAPQLGGGAYGYKTTFDAWRTVGADAAALRAEMRKVGQLTDDQMFEAVGGLKRGLVEGGLAADAKDALDGAARLSMFMYRAADTHNRVATRKIASSVLADAERGVPAAVEALRRLTPGYRTEVLAHLRAGNRDAAERAVQNYLLGSTQFNYDRISMSEYGRFMGHLFSMFSKWPASAIGELGGIVDARSIGRPIRGDVARLGWKYVAPLAIAQALQSGWWEEAREESPLLRKTLLGEDLVKFTPADTIRSLHPNRIVRDRLPPAVAAGVRAFDELSRGEIGDAAAAVVDFGLSGTPGATWVRFAAEELPEYLDVERQSPSIGKRLFGSADE